jgi:hypothetical protein
MSIPNILFLHLLASPFAGCHPLKSPAGNEFPVTASFLTLKLFEKQKQQSSQINSSKDGQIE